MDDCENVDSCWQKPINDAVRTVKKFAYALVLVFIDHRPDARMFLKSFRTSSDPIDESLGVPW
jgi:hypothetical protein